MFKTKRGSSGARARAAVRAALALALAGRIGRARSRGAGGGATRRRLRPRARSASLLAGAARATRSTTRGGACGRGPSSIKLEPFTARPALELACRLVFLTANQARASHRGTREHAPSCPRVSSLLRNTSPPVSESVSPSLRRDGLPLSRGVKERLKRLTGKSTLFSPQDHEAAACACSRAASASRSQCRRATRRSTRRGRARVARLHRGALGGRPARLEEFAHLFSTAAAARTTCGRGRPARPRRGRENRFSFGADAAAAEPAHARADEPAAAFACARRARRGARRGPGGGRGAQPRTPALRWRPAERRVAAANARRAPSRRLRRRLVETRRRAEPRARAARAVRAARRARVAARRVPRPDPPRARARPGRAGRDQTGPFPSNLRRVLRPRGGAGAHAHSALTDHDRDGCLERRGARCYSRKSRRGERKLKGPSCPLSEQVREQLFILGECFWRGGGRRGRLRLGGRVAVLRRAWWRHGLSRVSKASARRSARKRALGSSRLALVRSPARARGTRPRAGAPRVSLARPPRGSAASRCLPRRCVPDEDVNALASAMLSQDGAERSARARLGAPAVDVGRRDDPRTSLLDATARRDATRRRAARRRHAAAPLRRARPRVVRDRFGRLLSEQDMSSIATAMCREVEGHGCLEPDGSIADAHRARAGVLRVVLTQAVIAGAVAMAVYHCVG